MQYMCITYLWYVVVENVWFFSSLGSCTGLTYSLLTLSYVYLIYLFNYFIVYFILSMFLYSCATFSESFYFGHTLD